MAALVSSDFTLTNNGSTVTWTGGKLDITRPTTMTWELSNVTKNSGIIIAQSNLTWVTNSLSEDVGFMDITSVTSPTTGYSGPSTYSASIGSREVTGGKYRIGCGTVNARSYDVDSGIAKGKDVKITYDTSNNNIKFWYWNGSSWTQMGTTQVYNILNGGSIYMMLGYGIITNSIGTLTFDSIYFDTYAADYTTQYPSSGAVTKGNFLMFF